MRVTIEIVASAGEAMLPAAFDDVVALLWAENAAEAGFVRLRRVPATMTVKWLNCYADLTPVERADYDEFSAQIFAG